MKFLPSTIINFHAVYDEKWMKRVFLLLKKNYHVIPIHDVENYYYERGKLKSSCHITFDDGDASFYAIVFPILQNLKLPVSIYVSPKMARNRTNFWFQEIRGYDEHKLYEIINPPEQKPLGALFKNLKISEIWEVIHQYQRETHTPVKPGMNMKPDQLLELHQSGLVCIGAHTQNHPILKNESDEIVNHEITSSINELEEMLKTEIKYFAYPNGVPGMDFGIREIEVLRNAGIRLAFSIENRTISPMDDPLGIPRNGISFGSNAVIFSKLVMGRRWDMIKSLIKGKQEIDFRQS